MLLRYPTITILLFGLFILMPGTLSLPMIDRDGALFAQATKQMVESGDYWQIKMQEKKRHRKPPGYYWLQAASVNLVNPTELNDPFAYRLPALLGSLLSLWLLYFFTSRLFDIKTALIACIMLAGNFLFVFETHFAATDCVLLCSVIAIFGFCWLAYSQKTPLPWYHQLSLWLAVVIGIVIKGVAPLYALLTLCALGAADRSVAWVKRTGWLWGIPLTILLSLAWILPLNHATQSNFIWDILRIDFLPKLHQGVESHGNPPGYYFLLFHILFWPFTLFFWPMIMTAKNNISIAKIRFLVFWLVANWIGIELVPTKLPGYTMPLLPALTVLSALAVTNFPKMPTLVKRLHQGYYLVWAVISLVLITTFVSLPYLLGTVSKNMEILFMILCLAIAGTALKYTIKSFHYFSIIALAGLAITFNTILFDSLLPRLTPIWITESIVDELTLHPQLPINAKQPLYSVDYHEPSLIFRLGTWRVKFINLGEVKTLIKTDKTTTFIIPDKQFATIQNDQFKVLATISGFHYSKGKKKNYLLTCVNCQEKNHAE